MSRDTVALPRSLGHSIHHPVVGYDKAVFGRGQIIRQLVMSTSRGSRESDGVEDQMAEMVQSLDTELLFS